MRDNQQQPAPLSDEQLQQIRLEAASFAEWWQTPQETPTWGDRFALEAIPTLLAEVERLRASEDVVHASSRLMQQIDKTAAAKVRAFKLEEILREILEATPSLTGWDGSPVDWPDQLLERARAILAQPE